MKSSTSPSSKTSDALGHGDSRSSEDEKEAKNTNQGSAIPDIGVVDKSFMNGTPHSNGKETMQMPWSTIQDWALRENLPKYTVMIPLQGPDPNGGSSKLATQVYALWRTMLKDLPELAGYPIDYLQQKHSEQVVEYELEMKVTPGLLPFLEDYEFTKGGGISGRIFGVPGLADGTRIETSAVANVEVTLPIGFVRTVDGSAAYELGRPQREAFSSSNIGSLQGDLGTGTDAVKSGSYGLLKSVQGTASDAMEDADGMLVRLGATTGILLAGATAVNMLSHHLTVNVFWV